MDITEIKAQISELLKSHNPSAEQWADIMAYLQELKPFAVKEARAREVIALKKFRELRKNYKTRVDTEDEYKTTEEFKAYQDAKDRVDEIEDWKQVASRQVSAKYKSF